MSHLFHPSISFSNFSILMLPCLRLLQTFTMMSPKFLNSFFDSSILWLLVFITSRFLTVHSYKCQNIFLLYSFSNQLFWSLFHKMDVQNQKCYFEDWAQAQVNLCVNGFHWGIYIFVSVTPANIIASRKNDIYWATTIWSSMW